MTLDLVQTLSELVALPSVNPMGRAAERSRIFEYRVTDYLEVALPPAWTCRTSGKRSNRSATTSSPGSMATCRPAKGGQVVLFERTKTPCRSPA